MVPVVADVFWELPTAQDVLHEVLEVAEAKARREGQSRLHFDESGADGTKELVVREDEEHLLGTAARHVVLGGESLLFENVGVPLDLPKDSLGVLTVGDLAGVEHAVLCVERAGEDEVDVRDDVTVSIDIYPSLGSQGATCVFRLVGADLVEVPIEDEEFEAFVVCEGLGQGDLKVDRELPVPIVSVVDGCDWLEVAIGIVLGDIGEHSCSGCCEVMNLLQAAFLGREGIVDGLNEGLVALLSETPGRESEEGRASDFQPKHLGVSEISVVSQCFEDAGLNLCESDHGGGVRGQNRGCWGQRGGLSVVALAGPVVRGLRISGTNAGSGPA